MSSIKYLDEWSVEESFFDPNHLGKYEAIMAQGNGYLGIRNVHEEEYPHEQRNTFISGIFNRFSESEVSELANFPDVTMFEIRIDGELFSLLKGENSNYSRNFNYQTGESYRSFIWSDNLGRKLHFEFRKFVSMYDKHLIMTKVKIKNLGIAVNLSVSSGIDGTKTNSGSQHFEEGDKRYFDNQFLYLHTTTTVSKIPVAIASCLKSSSGVKSRPVMARRKIQEVNSFEMNTGEIFSTTKYSMMRTERDLEYSGDNYLVDDLISSLKTVTQEDYTIHLEKSAQAWAKIWNQKAISIDSEDFLDQLLLNFARYHIHVMSPIHDDRLNIGAKGMSGEGYKGHTFWDTEIFILPYFSYTFPEFAKNLVNYRMKGLSAAKKNAKINGYKGAQYPWESAWLSDGEVTPKWGDIDIITGEPTPILTGEIEHHVTADVIYGIADYLLATQDAEVDEKLFEVVMEAAKFWCSRSTYNREKDHYEILDVIGPDEYKEHVNNNAYTNYLAKFTLDRAIDEYNKKANSEMAVGFQKDIDVIREVARKIYLPQINEQGILPQDDTYLQKRKIDLTKYLNDDKVNTLFLDYNLEQVNNMQISKQADVLLLMLMFSNKFSLKAMRENWNYYYPKTLHDSSLSLSTHCNYALLISEEELAYQLFKKSFDIDLGSNNMASSDMGIHSAAMGGIWQNVVRGFGGFALDKDGIVINPKLPATWRSLIYTVVFRESTVKVCITRNNIKLKILNGSPIKVTIRGKEYHLGDCGLTVTI